MDNATRKELLYRARAAGYPGSILDVYANYDQGKDIIAEFQDQQRHQQMSQMASQQSGLQQGGQQPQIDMQPQPVAMPAIPSSPTPSPNFTPPQPPQPIGVQSQDAPMGIVSNQSGPNQGRAIFKEGGFKEKNPPTEPIYVYSKDDPDYKKYLQQKAYYDKQKAIYEMPGPGYSGDKSSYDDFVELTYRNAEYYKEKFDPEIGIQYVHEQQPNNRAYVFRKPSPVILEKESNPEAIDIKPLPMQQVDLKPQLKNVPVQLPTRKHPVIKSTGDAAIDKLNKELYGPSGDYFATGGFKYEEGGPIKGFDLSKSMAENLELNRRANVMGWNSVEEYEKSGWGYSPLKQKQQELVNNPEAQKFAKPIENKDQLSANKTSGAQKTVNQAYNVLSNPIESAGHAMKYGYVPQGNLGNYGHRGDADAFAMTVNDFVNPFAWGNAAYRLSNEIGNKKSWTSKEGLATMGTDALEATPFFGKVAKAAPIISRVAKPLEESYDVGKQLSKIKTEGIKAGKNEFEIAKEQLKKVGITSNQRRGYTPGVSEVFNKYVMPLGYEGEAGTSKLAQTLENIGYGGWEKRLRSSDVEVFSPEKINMRADAWRMYLGMPQQHGTFKMANTAPAMHPSYKPGSLKGMDIYSIPEDKVFTRSSKFRESNPSGDNFIKPLDNPIILDRDANIMGGYNKVLSKDGLQYNDIWDLEPTISYNRLVPEKIKKMLPEKVNQKLFYKEVPINTTNSLTLQQPRGIKIPVSKFVGKPFMSHGNLNYTSADYILDAQKHLTDRLNIVAPEGSSSQILRGHPSTDVRFNKAVKIEEQLKKLNSGEYPKYKKGGVKCYTCVGRKHRV